MSAVLKFEAQLKTHVCGECGIQFARDQVEVGTVPTGIVAYFVKAMLRRCAGRCNSNSIRPQAALSFIAARSKVRSGN